MVLISSILLLTSIGFRENFYIPTFLNIIANFLHVLKRARIFGENTFWSLDLQQITEFLVRINVPSRPDK